MPPPISRIPVKAARTVFTMSTFTGLPALAPSKSTRCKAPTLAASYCFAWSTGSGLMTVSCAKSPLYRRTLRPSCKSIAGKIIHSPLLNNSLCRVNSLDIRIDSNCFAQCTTRCLKHTFNNVMCIATIQIAHM